MTATPLASRMIVVFSTLSRFAFRDKPLLIVHGFQREQRATLSLEASRFENVRLAHAPMDMPYGTHHT